MGQRNRDTKVIKYSKPLTVVISNWKDSRNSCKIFKKKQVSSKEKEGNKTTNNVLSSVFFDYKEKKMYRDISDNSY